MEQLSCTQNEMMQVMQKLLSERHKAKLLEQELQHLRKDPSTTDMNILSKSSQTAVPNGLLSQQAKELALLKERVDASEKEKIKAFEKEAENNKQVELLKNIIKELAEKLKTQIAPPATIEKSPADESTVQLKQSLYQSQNEVRAVKEKCASLEEEVRRLQQYHISLQSELKEQNGKGRELEALKFELSHVDEKQKMSLASYEVKLQQAKEYENSLKAEIESYQTLCVELKSELSKKIHSDHPQHDLQRTFSENAEALAKEKINRERLELALEDKELLFHELSQRNKELEAKNQHALSEKDLSLISYKEAKKQLSDQNSLNSQLTNEKEALVLSNSSLILAVEEQKKLLEKTFEELNQKSATLLEAEAKIQTLLHTVTQTEESQKLLEARDADYKKEKLEKERLAAIEVEQKNHIDLLEQHLARRVKECALLTRSQEEQEHEYKVLKDKLEETKKNVKRLEEELSQKEEELQDVTKEHRLEKEELKVERQALFEHAQSQSQELEELKKLEEKYLLLEELLDQCGHIFTKKAHESLLQKSVRKQEQKTLLEQAAPKRQQQLPVAMSSDLFEKPKEKNIRHDLFQ